MIHGQLFWVPEEGTKAPLGAVVVLVVIVLAAFATVFVVRRRRGGRVGGPPGAGTAAKLAGHTSPDGFDQSVKEAW